MWTIFKKEFFSFFSSPLGVLIILMYLLINGFILWVFNTPFNIYNAAYADLSLFFELSPWMFLFLIPSICMKSFSEEKRQGTLELLFTKPLQMQQIIVGKYCAALMLSIMAILPTVLYILSLYYLAETPQKLDYGAILASYVGLLFLISVYTALGILSSTLSNNQLMAFILGVVFCLFFYYALTGLARLEIIDTDLNILEYFSLQYHYKSMTRGVIDTRDIVYFVSITLLSIHLAKWRLKFIKA